MGANATPRRLACTLPPASALPWLRSSLGISALSFGGLMAKLNLCCRGSRSLLGAEPCTAGALAATRAASCTSCSPRTGAADTCTGARATEARVAGAAGACMVATAATGTAGASPATSSSSGTAGASTGAGAAGAAGTASGIAKPTTTLLGVLACRDAAAVELLVLKKAVSRLERVLLLPTLEAGLCTLGVSRLLLPKLLARLLPLPRTTRSVVERANQRDSRASAERQGATGQSLAAYSTAMKPASCCTMLRSAEASPTYTTGTSCSMAV
mmetsp:Transcript_10857/g.23378  ORF Transcript_10857/g.23378 Transcript_10857/m.23378 type:complete len:271 (+) Transcript_10857:1116-1928(+)